MRATRLLRLPFALAVATALLTQATPSEAYEFQGSGLENAIANTLDVAIVRPLASARVLVGGILLVPAALLTSPGGLEPLTNAYDLLLAEPMEYAFERKLGDFE